MGDRELSSPLQQGEDGECLVAEGGGQLQLYRTLALKHGDIG